MAYDYSKQRQELFKPDGVAMLLKVRDNVNQLIDTAGAFEAGKAWDGVTGDSWTMLACLDYLVETGELRRLDDPSRWSQHQIYCRPGGGR